MPIPDLNEERRRELTRVAAKYAEAARVSVRNVRRDGSRPEASKEKDGEISAGQQRKLQHDIQTLTDQTHQAHRRHAGAEGQGNPSGLMMQDRLDMPAPPPRHVAIIMDGNGRWAQVARPAAHRRPSPRRRGGAAHASTAAAELGIRYLDLFGFSSENWKRPVGRDPTI